MEKTVRLSECLIKVFPNMGIASDRNIRAICKIDDKPCLNLNKHGNGWKIHPIGTNRIALTGCCNTYSQNCFNCERNGN